jgi:hypothetical protein
MADLCDVYGDQYRQESYQLRINHVLNKIATNLAHRDFQFRLENDSSAQIWSQYGDRKMSSGSIEYLIKQMKTINPAMEVSHLQSIRDKQLIPELITDSPVEYLMIIDHQKNRAYIIYITPMEVGAF